VKTFLKIVAVLAVLVILAVVALALSPQGRAVIGMTRSIVAAASSPAAQELMKHGCDTAFVAQLGELVASMGKLVDLSEDADAAKIIAENPTLLFCAAKADGEAPECANLARAYGTFDKAAPPKFGVMVQASDKTTCAGYFAPSGVRIADFDPATLPVDVE
jgi:hypothetical protein